ncbi:MAG: YczE/YyaS/YitT family protein [Nocardioides sp.]
MSTMLVGQRTAQLLIGLWLFGASIALLVRADLGLDPWDVLHQGVARHAGVSIGVVVVAASFVVLALWVPLRQRPGVGTVANVLLVGMALDSTLVWLPAPEELSSRSAFLLVGVVANGLATSMYIGAGLGPGPRDGLMTGLAGRGLSIRRARTTIEVTVLAAGWILGGTVGVGTLVYAVGIGPLVHHLLPLFANRPHPGEVPA